MIKKFATNIHYYRLLANLVRREKVSKENAVDFLAEQEMQLFNIDPDKEKEIVKELRKIVADGLSGIFSASCSVGLFGRSDVVAEQYAEATKLLADKMGLCFRETTIHDFVYQPQDHYDRITESADILLLVADMGNRTQRDAVENIIDGHYRQNVANTVFTERARHFDGLISLLVLSCDIDELASRYALSLRLLQNDPDWPLISPSLFQEAANAKYGLSPTEKNMIITYSCCVTIPSVGYNSWDRMRFLEAA